MKCTIYIETRVRSIITGLESHHLQLLIKEYSLFVDAAKYTKTYLLGHWDGYVNFIKNSGETYTPLLENIIKLLVQWGYHIEIDDRRPVCDFECNEVTEDMFSEYGIVLRDYQVASANELLFNDSGVIIAGTGAGKTLICAAVCKQYENVGLKTCVVVPDQLLTMQTVKTFANVNIDVGQYTGTHKDIEHSCIVSTWQALKNNQAILHDIDIVIIDECHKLTGKVLNEMIYTNGQHFKGVYGVTGTLPINMVDRMSVQSIVGPVRFKIKTNELIENNWLAVPNITINPITVDLTTQHTEFLNKNSNARVTYQEFKNGFFPDYISEKKYLMANKPRVEKISKMILQASKNGNVLCLVSNIQIGKKLQKLIPNSVFLKGSTDVELRQEVGELFETDDGIIAIATVNIAGTGWSITRIHVLILIDIGKSFTRVIQSIGRGLRKGDDKTHVDIYDICSDTYFSKKHMSERIRYYKNEKLPYITRPIQIGDPIDNF
jgi:superfamily II DNA or RNA helicase